MRWKGTKLVTMGQACKALEEITTKEEAQEFLRLAKVDNPEHAEQNIGYLLGYFDRETWKRLSGLLGISHPIFGDRFDISDGEVLQLGIERGRAIRERKA